MIVFDLACRDHGHVFEAWFGSTGDYDAQCARGLVSCPMCGSQEIEKAVMAPRIGAKGNQRPDTTPIAVSNAMDSQEPVKAMMRALAEAQARALENSVYVGTRFAEEARSIHLGETDQRQIHGQATIEEAKALHDEGIAVAPLPFPVRPPGTDN